MFLFIFCLEFELPKAQPYWFADVMKISKKACDVFDIFATCASLAHDVTDTDWGAHSGSTHGREIE